MFFRSVSLGAVTVDYKGAPHKDFRIQGPDVEVRPFYYLMKEI